MNNNYGNEAYLYTVRLQCPLAYIIRILFNLYIPIHN